MSSEQSPAAHAALDAEYEILRELGRGGTALVYLARERASGAEVAIKLIRSKYIEDEEALARFAREARFVAQLDHPNIVPVRTVLDLGTSGIALVMAHVAGRTLKQVIKADGRLTPVRTGHVMRDIGRALSAAHAMGIIHRDVKPENIFIDAKGRAVLADFGLARSMTADTQLTMSGVAIGTPAYMAPEQIEGGELDARADVYSLGLVGWEMLTGHRPWDGQSLYAVLYNQKHEFLPDVRDLRDDVPDRLADVIVRSIEKDREARWQNIHELLSALDNSTAPPLSPRRPPASADTTRFVRPAVTALPAAQGGNAVADQAERPVARSSPTLPLLTPPYTPPPLVRRSKVVVVRAGAALAAVVLIALPAVLRGRPGEASPRASVQAMRPILSGDVAKPVPIGSPIDSLAVARRDTSHLLVTATSPPANTAISNDTAAARRATATSSKSPSSPTPPTTLRASAAPASAVPASAAPASAAPASAPPATAAPATATLATAALAGPPVVAPRLSIVAGGMHSCFNAADGRVFCWGNNDRGQLGNGGTARAPAPLLVGGDAHFAAVVAGLSHNCAIARGGAAWCWGYNDHGQLGDRSFVQRLAPVRAAEQHVFRTIAAGAAHTCGLDPAGIAWCWGSDAFGQLGDSSDRDSAVPVSAGMGATRFASIAAGWNFTCALAANGRASCWGENTAGQLGDGTTSDRHTPTMIGSDIAFTSIATGSAHACGVTAQGEAYCWGRNTNGQLGDGTNADRTTPVRVRSNAHFASITAGAVHTCAVTDDGDAYCWGRNTYGQLGNGTNTDASQPTSVTGGHIFASVRAFGSHTCGATVSGGALCWGYNLESQLGDGTRIHRTRPVVVETPGGG